MKKIDEDDVVQLHLWRLGCVISDAIDWAGNRDHDDELGGESLVDYVNSQQVSIFRASNEWKREMEQLDQKYEARLWIGIRIWNRMLRRLIVETE